MTQDEANAYATGLRKLADFIEARPDLVPSCSDHVINFWPHQCDGIFPMAVREAGALTKRVVGDLYCITKDFGGGVRLEWNEQRDKVCTRVKIGEKVVPASPEKVIPAEPEKVIEEFEWVCPESLLKATAIRPAPKPQEEPEGVPF